VIGDVVNAADVWVTHPSGGGDFLTESSEPVGIVGHVGREELEGDRLAQYQIVGPIYLAHPALANRRDHPEPTSHDLAKGEPTVGLGPNRGDGRRDVRDGGQRIDGEGGAAARTESTVSG
jgi:hypothetical protein